MIVTVVAMFMMQLAIMQIIDMISMWNPLVPAINMIASTLHRHTGSRVFLTYSDHMIIVMLFMREVQMTIMQIISVPFMFDCDMPTISTVCMDMFFVTLRLG